MQDGTTQTTSDGSQKTTEQTTPEEQKQQQAPAEGAQTPEQETTPPNFLKPDEEGQEGEQKQAEVPEEYDLKPPEGFQEIPEELTTEFVKVAREAGFSQEQAQKAFEAYLQAQQQEAVRLVEETRRQIEEWAEESRKMWGDNFEKNRAVAAKAYSEVTREIPEIADVIEGMGLGTHPAVLKLFHRIGQLTQEDTFEGGKNAAPQANEEELLARMYPKTAKR